MVNACAKSTPPTIILTPKPSLQSCGRTYVRSGTTGADMSTYNDNDDTIWATASCSRALQPFCQNVRRPLWASSSSHQYLAHPAALFSCLSIDPIYVVLQTVTFLVFNGQGRLHLKQLGWWAHSSPPTLSVDHLLVHLCCIRMGVHLHAIEYSASQDTKAASILRCRLGAGSRECRVIPKSARVSCLNATASGISLHRASTRASSYSGLACRTFERLKNPKFSVILRWAERLANLLTPKPVVKLGDT